MGFVKKGTHLTQSMKYNFSSIDTLIKLFINCSLGFFCVLWLTKSIEIGLYFLTFQLITSFIQVSIIEKYLSKKKNTGVTEGKVKSQIKAYDKKLPKTQAPPPPKPPQKKVLNYSSNR